MMIKKSNFNSETLHNIWFLPLVCGLFFSIGLWLFFPDNAVQMRIEQELSQQLQRPVTVGVVDLDLPLTLTIDSLETTVLPQLTVQLEQLKARPVWLSLLQGKPAVTLQGQTFGGTIHAEMNTARQLQLNGSNLHWDQPIPQLPNIRINTTIEQLNSRGFIDPINQLEQLELHLTNLVISGIKEFGAPIDQLNLGRVELQLNQVERQLNINTFTATGGDINLDGHGTIILQRNIMRSRIDLPLTLTPSKTLDATVSSLLPLIAKQQVDGSYQLRVTGTIEMPRLR